MGIFKGNYSSSIQQNHQFFCDEFLDFNKEPAAKDVVKLIKQLGLMSFTKNSCKDIFNNNLKFIKNTSLYNRLPQNAKNGLTVGQTVIEYGFINAYYTEFNKSAARFNDATTSIDSSTINQLINYHENRQFDDTYARSITFDTLLEKINTSLEKSIIIQVNFFGLGNVIFKLIFQSRTVRSNDRGIALNGITLSSIPATPYNLQYSHANTLNVQTQGIQGVGSLIPIADENNTFSQDKTAAKLQVSFDPNTNTFKSGNPQMLARLLTDVEPAELQSLPEIGVDLNTVSTDDMLERLSPFTTGKALPLSPQQGNPFLFGPDYVDCARKKIVEITVVNRSLRKFTRDQIVMLTEINGEWIIQDFGKDSAFESSTKFGDWHFIKLIANTDTYFKDDRYYETGDFGNPITPTEYETQSRLKFYGNKLTALANNEDLTEIYGPKITDIININRPNGVAASLVPSKRYYISSIFDQLAPEACGFSDQSYLVATNVEDGNVFGDKTLLFKYGQELPGFWGPVYSDGHSSLALNPNGRDNTNTIFFKHTSSTLQLPENFLKDYFPQYNGNYKLHIPAECSSTFINPSAIFLNWNQLGSIPIAGPGSSIQSPFYGTTIPATRNRIQFSPLQAELAGSDDLLSTKAKDYSRQFYNIIRAVIGTKLGIDTTDITTLFGNSDQDNLPKMYQRSTELLGYPNDEFLITDISRCSSPSYDNAQASFTEVGNFKSIKYDCFVRKGGVNSGLVGSPAIFRKSGGTDGGYCVGIISAKNTITKKSGGKLIYSLNQDFGLNQQRASTLATNFITIIPGIFSGGGSAGGGMSYGFPQWGSTTDNISSFGTTALHLRIFDYWPETATVFDPRYFGVLHFNPDDESVDLPIPTRLPPTTTTPNPEDPPEEEPPAVPLQILSLGDLISYVTALAPKSSWRKSTIRRGMFLTGGGFKYLAHQIGLLESSSSVVFGGTGFNANFEFEIKSKEVILNVQVASGAVTGVSIKEGSPIKCHTSRGTDFKYRGINFLPSDFNTNVPNFVNGELSGTTSEKAFIINIPSPTPSGKTAIIKFSYGEVYFQELIDNPPAEQVPLTRLTSSSKRGEGFIQEVKESDFTLEKNSNGKYDCFYHFHNDITHTLMTDQPFVAGFLQHVTMTIT
jgi:hypothetical protein